MSKKLNEYDGNVWTVIISLRREDAERLGFNTGERWRDNPNITEVFLCMDSDEPGQAAARRISDKLFTQGINARILVPEHKDWNEDLLYLNQDEIEVEEPCQVLQL